MICGFYKIYIFLVKRPGSSKSKKKKKQKSDAPVEAWIPEEVARLERGRLGELFHYYYQSSKIKII